TLVEGRERLLELARAANRLDDPLDPAAEVLVDLGRLPALGRAAERVADRRPCEAADGALGQQVTHLATDARPATRQILAELVEGDLVLEVLDEVRRRHLALPARVGRERHPVAL